MAVKVYWKLLQFIENVNEVKIVIVTVDVLKKWGLDNWNATINSVVPWFPLELESLKNEDLEQRVLKI